jgi:hypothetical protein
MTTGLDKERETAALELCGVLQGLITTGSVPEYMVGFIASRIMRLRRAYGLPMLHIVENKESADA